MPTLKEIADRVGGEVDGPPDLELRDLRPVDGAGADDLVFVNDERHAAKLAASEAAAVICTADLDVGGRPAIRVENPRAAAAVVLRWLHPEPRPAPGRHPTAVVAEDATVPTSCSIGAYAVIGAGSELGEGVVLGPHVVVGQSVRIGDETRIDPNVTLYAGVTIGQRCEIHAGAVIGGSGFGYEPTPAGPIAFPQIGTVVLGDDVRIGANTTVDRAAFDETRIGDGTKIDNLVQIGHNVVIGDGVLICALAGMAGGAEAQSHTILGPQSALAPDSVLGTGTILGARAALMSNQKIEDPGAVYMGGPTVPLREWLRYQAFKVRGKWKSIK